MTRQETPVDVARHHFEWHTDWSLFRAIRGSILCAALAVTASPAAASVLVTSFTHNGGPAVTEGETVTLTANVASNTGTISSGSALVRADTSSSDTQAVPVSQSFDLAGVTSTVLQLATTYRDDGFASARINGGGNTPGGGNSFSRNLNFSVLNVNPSLTSFQFLSNPSATYFEGDIAGMRFEVTDPGFFDDQLFFINGRLAATHTTDTLDPRIVVEGVPLFQQGFDTTVQLVAQARDKDGGLSNSIVGPTVRVLNLDPIIRNATADSGVLPDALFDFSATADDAGLDPLTYLWDLDDDGEFDDFTGTGGQHSFSALGTHRISVRVHDDGGGTSTPRTLLVTVVPEPSTLALAAFGVAALAAWCWRPARSSRFRSLSGVHSLDMSLALV